ncbi:hypothetical protein EC973_001474 [Apophysomyces ossiformis]|uniref:SWIM-type domain-containing protein n=1 Tax=Apophysomyces ossiformis TaxID=679940 RepID=A0A8H7BLY4_9FUNG|nr:hypothetical protein EC973_001474 [Apophysomyces ossiformis]
MLFYTVEIGPVISCTCMDHRMRGAHCKHILMILLKVFRLRPTAKAFRSLTLSRTDVEEMYDNCVPDPSVLADEQLKQKINEKIYGPPSPTTTATVERRPLDTSDCPICFDEFKESEISKILFCKKCRNNIHQVCFDSWAAMRGSDVTCVYCRSPWEDDRSSKKDKGKRPLSRGPEGYVNFATEAGVSLKRALKYSHIWPDTSTYRR